jgi:hypothetical protein
MQPEGSLPCPQKPSTDPILSHVNPVHTFVSYIFKFHFNIILPPTP